MSSLCLIVWLGLCFVMALQQYVVWHLLPPEYAVGDEKAYLEHGAQQDPYRPRMFLRTPVMHWLARRCFLSGRPEGAFRVVMAVTGVVTAGIVLWLAALVAGVVGILTCGAILFFLIERPILNQHLWPDPLLACCLAVIQLLLYTVQEPMTCGCLCGLVVAMAAMTRLEQLALLPGVLLALLARGASPDLLLVASVAVPTALAYLLWTVHNGLRYGIWLPDDTWMFNLTVMKSEVDNAHRGPSVNELVLHTAEVWRKEGRQWQSGVLFSMVRTPVSFVYQLLLRAISLAGPDTFIRQRLLPPRGRVYTQRPGWVAAMLYFSVPALVTVACLCQFHAPLYPPPFLIPAAFCLAAFCAFHTRTRYRVALLPALAVWVAWLAETAAGWPQLDFVTCLSLFVAAVAFILLLVFVRQETCLS